MLPIFASPENQRPQPPLLSFFLRRWRRFAAALVLLWLVKGYYDQLPPARVHEVTSRDIESEAEWESAADPATGYLPLPDAQALCRAHGWEPFNQDGRQPRRKIYDLLMVNNEMDWLEIRMDTMAAQVDYFVVLEAAVTFTGLAKPLTLQDNWGRFARFHDKMIYKVLEDPPLGARRTWDYEDYQRNAMFTQVVPGLEGERAPRLGDVILVADVDEIVRPAALQLLRNCAFPRRLTLRSRFYYYGFQFLHKGLDWAHPQATTFQGAAGTVLPQNLRNGDGDGRLALWREKADLWNAGWHCSSCFATMDDLLTKMQSFSHMLLNKPQYRDRDRIADRVSRGVDLWDRKGEEYEKLPNNKDIPGILKREPERFRYLVDREGPNAGFTDYHPERGQG